MKKITCINYIKLIPKLIHKMYYPLLSIAIIGLFTGNPSLANPKPGEVFREYHITGGGSNGHEDMKWANEFVFISHHTGEAGTKGDRIFTGIDLENAVKAEFVASYWGGHIGSENRRVVFNNNPAVNLPLIKNTPNQPECYFSQQCQAACEIPLDYLTQGEKLVWGCEADTMVMLTEILADKVLQEPFFMTNLYPFIMGKAALSHERIPHFPKVDEPENHLLAAHCGYFGLLPEPFANKWNLKKRVLTMVNENATVIDATMPTGSITLVKFQPYLNKLSLSEANLIDYIQYENSDCLNGGIIKVKDGQNFVDKVVSHHYIVMQGHQKAALKLISGIFNYEIEEI